MWWYIKFPTDAYALGPIEARGKAEVLRWAREWAGVKRLPRGFQCWKA